MATGSDVKGILERFQNEKKEEVALSKILRQQAKERKTKRPQNIPREVFALMNKEAIEKI